MPFWHPSIQDILTAHEVVKENSRVRTEGLKGSREKGLERIQEVLEDARSEDDVYGSAAIYLQKLIEKHPFNDGNKRTAVMITDRFLQENNESFSPHKIQNTDELHYAIKWELPSMSIEETAQWIKTGETPNENTT
ncbi:MAG: hypothetical protein BRC29_00850 [Nanohaloarchaea archaeon SW_7_43_1]|nr:MAG: hypothetical protein BRC29_00850 [Nanohaloarchaea archaeon SW_7_43_1]